MFYRLNLSDDLFTDLIQIVESPNDTKHGNNSPSRVEPRRLQQSLSFDCCVVADGASEVLFLSESATLSDCRASIVAFILSIASWLIAISSLISERIVWRNSCSWWTEPPKNRLGTGSPTAADDMKCCDSKSCDLHKHVKQFHTLMRFTKPYLWGHLQTQGWDSRSTPNHRQNDCHQRLSTNPVDLIKNFLCLCVEVCPAVRVS